MKMVSLGIFWRGFQRKSVPDVRTGCWVVCVLGVDGARVYDLIQGVLLIITAIIGAYGVYTGLKVGHPTF